MAARCRPYESGLRSSTAGLLRSFFSYLAAVVWGLVVAGMLSANQASSRAGAVGDVGGVAEAVALGGIDDELGLDVFGAEGVPELVGLGSGALAVAVADDDEGGGW